MSRSGYSDDYSQWSLIRYRWRGEDWAVPTSPIEDSTP